MLVTHFSRRPFRGYFSLERLFADVRRGMPPEVTCRVRVARFLSLGLWRRVYNILEAPFFGGDINHVTGDIHYVDLLLPKGRTLLTVHDCASLERLKGWRREVLRLFWYTIPVGRAGLVSVISEATRVELLRHVTGSSNKVRVVPNCVSPSFQPYPKHFNADRPIVLHIGTGKNKNLLRVAQALSGVSCHLRVVGRLDHEQKDALLNYNIQHTSSEDLSDEEVVAAYRECDLVIFASTYEGFGLPILEANATGRPVVTSNLLSMPEVAGDAACLVDPFDVNSIRAGVLHVIESEEYRERLIKNGYRNVERFSPTAVAQQYVALYRELAHLNKRK